MTTTPSDEELENIARAARRKAYKAHGYNCTHDEEFERRDLYEAGLAAGRAEREPFIAALTGQRDSEEEDVDALRASLLAAEQKLAALVEGLRVITLHVAQYGYGTMPAMPVNQRLTALMSAALQTSAPETTRRSG